MENTISALPVDDDRTILETGEAYDYYFSLLCRMCETLLQTYEAEERKGSYEARMMKLFVSKFLYTVKVLRMKFTHSPAHNRLPWLDLSDSGFPNHAEITKLETDLLSKDSQLADIPMESLLKLKLLDHMFQNHEESRELLWQLSERAYLEALDIDRLFLAFTPGELVRQKDTKTGRSYTYSWAYYGFETNIPYVHIMSFEQDMSEEPLESNATLMRHFLKVIRAEGARVPDIQFLALQIDDALEPIHPKIIKRVGIGPMYSPLIHSEAAEGVEQVVCSLIKRFGNRIDDFMVFYTLDMIFSESQKVSSGLFSGKRVREIFHIPSTDDEAFKRRASLVQKGVVMPHGVRQHISPEERQLLGLDKLKVVTYDQRGGVHGA